MKYHIVLLLLAISFYGLAAKKVQPLKDLTWTVVDSLTVQTTIELPATTDSKLFLESNAGNSLNRVLVDNLPVGNLKQDKGFTAEILNTNGSDEATLTLIFNHPVATASAPLAERFEGMFLSSVSGISITWCEPIKDPFFGGYMIEVHSWNLLPRDIDGKLIARISNAETLDLVAENNNCAFSRSNSESIIDINFPEAKEKLIKGNYLIEISLVDKEKNEELVDQLIAPIVID